MLNAGSFSSPGRRVAAEVCRAAVDFVAEGRTGKRVDGERYRDLGEVHGEGAAVFARVQSQRLDVPQQGDPAVETGLCPSNLLQAAQERYQEQGRALPGVIEAARGMACHMGKFMSLKRSSRRTSDRRFSSRRRTGRPENSAVAAREIRIRQDGGRRRRALPRPYSVHRATATPHRPA